MLALASCHQQHDVCVGITAFDVGYWLSTDDPELPGGPLELRDWGRSNTLGSIALL
jgi:hypothetical protein